MATQDQSRLEAARMRPRITELWFALRPLTSVLRVMNTGAHPDDEMSGMLSALGLRDGVNLSYACSTRGEGGQNDIGPESGAALGALRTREMERACDVLNMRLYWHGTAPDDSIRDFGFSKSGEETVGIWGRDQLMARFVRIVRLERPEVLIPTFLDVPGQHGHHRAMTQAAFDVIEAAADPAFGCVVSPWQVKKLYLPAWSGAGRAYDDDVPPPHETTRVPGGADPVTGWSYPLIGQMSRGFHRTQGMGQWETSEGAGWPLHLAYRHGSLVGEDRAIWDGLPRRVADLADRLPATGDLLFFADDAINACVASFADTVEVAEHARAAAEYLDQAAASCVGQVGPVHLLEEKRAQLARVLMLAEGLQASARTQDVWLRPGGRTALTVEARGTTPEVDLPVGWTQEGDEVVIGADAAATDAYRDCYDPLRPKAPRLVVGTEAGPAYTAFEAAPVVLPPRAVRTAPADSVVNLETARRSITLRFSGVHPQGAEVTLGLPEGWASAAAEDGTRITLPDDVTEGLYAIPVLVDGHPAQTERRISYPHTDATVEIAPAEVRVRVLRAVLPTARIGYVGSGQDAVAHWLAEMGANVTVLSDTQIGDAAELARFDSIVIGIFAFRFRQGLSDVVPLLHDWVTAGGTLLTLYHRPWDNWDPDATPPRRIEIGQPSLRWRVTDQGAPVTMTDHPLFEGPNRIGPEDWDGWVKERGLYFAQSWDAAYDAPLSMSDAGEEPLNGALLTATIGKGRHTHCALTLHHQMANLVPGAFRLMANLVSSP